jgi:hypothetical protein
MKILSYPIAELTGKVDGIAGDIKQKGAELPAAISANEVIAQMGSRNNAAARVVGRISLFLETLLPNEDFAKLEAENRRLNNKVRQLEGQIGPTTASRSHSGRENRGSLGRCLVEQRAPRHHLLVHGLVLRSQDCGTRSSRDRRSWLGNGHPARMDGGRSGAVGRSAELLVPRAGV